MATLFFEGFDKGIVFNQLDPAYWSTQFKQYPKYAFGGYSLSYDYYNNTLLKVNTYSYSSPNGGVLPTGHFNQEDAGTYNAFPSNAYPGFGSPPGFLAFTNIEIENNSNVEYPTYLQASGFLLPSGNTTYLAMRCLGIETKHTGYSNYPYRHTLFSYNSGNLEQLTVNIVKITGTNNFIPINGKYETLALEIQQNNNTIGYFDLNIVNNITGYRLASVYDSDNTILTIAHSISGRGYTSVISRWTHLEFSIDQSDNQEPFIAINAEDINLPVINFDNEIPREDWEISLPISGFNFNNLRFYNRTYSSTIKNNVTDFGPFNGITQDLGQKYYYTFGKTWLLDDLVLIDNTGLEPSYWLGSSARVTQLIPGTISGDGNNIPSISVIDNMGRVDGIKDWTTNTSVTYNSSVWPYPSVTEPSHRLALSFTDNDTKSIEAINSGAINAIAFSQRTNNTDPASTWRETLNEAVGGVKIYNSARKKYLDTKFVNVFRSGISDNLESNISLLLHGDAFPIVDSTKIPKSITNNNVITKGDNLKFSGGSIYFTDEAAKLTVSHSDLANNPFTIECWIYFKNHNQIISLFDKSPDAFAGYPYGYCSQNYIRFYASTTGILFQRNNNCDKTLLFNSGAQTGIWNHIAIVRTTGDNLRCFLNGVANTGFNISNCENRPCYTENVDPVESQGTYAGTYSLNFLNSKSLISDTTIIKIGQPKSLTLTDEYFNNVSLLVKSDSNSLIDLSTNTKSITNTNVVFSYNHSRFGDKSLYFTGGSTLAFDNSSDFNFGSGDFTIDFWYYLNNTNSSTTYKLFNSNNFNLKIITRDSQYGGNPTLQAYVTDSNQISYGLHTANGQYRLGIEGQGGFTIDFNKWYYINITKYLGDLFVYIVPIYYSVTPSYVWPLYLLKNESVLNPFTGTYNNTYTNFAMDLNGFSIGDSNSNLSHNLYIDSFRITKGIARITTRLLSAVSSPSQPFGTSLPPEQAIDSSIYMDEYRITYGANRYNSNFTPPSQPFKNERDDYYPLGPEYTVNKTSYKTFQHYALQNPATQQNWKTSEISGMILGVKKL